MKAGVRIGLAALMAAFAPAPLLAQNSVEPASPVAIGPPPLEGFSLKGTVTRRAEPVASAPPRPEQPQAPPSTPRPEPRAQSTAPASAVPQRSAPAAPPIEIAEPSRAATFELPPIGAAGEQSAAPPPVTAPAFTPSPALPPAVPDPSTAAGSVLGEAPVPWLFAALLLAFGAGYYFFRQRSRAFAGVTYEIVSPPAPVPAPPEPAPRPVPEQLKRATSPGSSGGIVSTRLRPWLDLDFVPIRFVLTEEKAVLEFEMSVQNSGAGVARDVQIEAAMLTASPSQDEEIGALFAHPKGAGSPVQAILPMKRMNFANKVELTRDQLKLFQVDGKLMFVPVIAFTALYQWNGNRGQTSASYIVGRETKGEKLGPLRADLGPRVFRNLDARSHPVGVRK